MDLFNTVKQYAGKFTSTFESSDCYQHCNSITSNSKNVHDSYAYRVYCKKGCDMDDDKYDDCVNSCKEMCFKGNISEDKKFNFQLLDRSPGDPDSSQRCLKLCTSACNFKFSEEKK